MSQQPEIGERKRILITGGAGFIGSHLVRRCVAEGHEVHVLLRPKSSVDRLVDVLPTIRVHRLSLSDRDTLCACVRSIRPTQIFHLAHDTQARHDVACGGALASIDAVTNLLTLLDAVSQLENPPQAFVRTGSMAEYGSGLSPFREEQREQPTTSYGAAMVAGTHYAMMSAPHLAFPIITARLALVYGPSQAEDFIIPGLIAACLGRRTFVVKRPRDRRDLLHVSDAVDGLCRLAASPQKESMIVNIGSGEAVDMSSLARHIAMLTGADFERITMMRHTEPETLLLCSEKMSAITGWTPRIHWREGLAMLVKQAWADRLVVSA